jgi:hypothetical protein
MALQGDACRRTPLAATLLLAGATLLVVGHLSDIRCVLLMHSVVSASLSKDSIMLAVAHPFYIIKRYIRYQAPHDIQICDLGQLVMLARFGGQRRCMPAWLGARGKGWILTSSLPSTS